jgi:hypothetical protein
MIYRREISYKTIEDRKKSAENFPLRRQTMKDLLVRTHTFTMLTSRLVAIVVFAALLFAAPSHAALAATAPSLGTAATFAVLGSSTVTCTGPSIITGDLGVSPGSAVTGFPVPCTVVGGGAIHAADAVAAQAQLDALAAYNALVAEPCTTNLTGTDLGGLTLGPGVYCFNSSAQLTGILNLTGGGPWIFQIGSTLTTASGSSVLINGKSGSQGCAPGAFWAVGSSATLGTTTQFQGVIIAHASDTLTTGANVSGQVIALTGAVTLDSNHVSACNEASGGGSQCTLLQPSSISSNFNGTCIPAGDFIWFSANASISGIPTNAGDQTVSVTNQMITIPGVGSFLLPATEVTFSTSYSCASVSFNTVTQTWEVHVPFSGSDEIFIGGFALPVPAGLACGIKGVTWAGTFTSTAPSASINWKWGAAVYTAPLAFPVIGPFTGYAAFDVKPTHTNACLYNNSDHAGTPEAFKSFVIGGATGGGGSNFTGSWSGTGNACRPPQPPKPIKVGPIHVGQADIGTCNNTWALDTFDKVYTITANGDGTSNVEVVYNKGTFVTVAGMSPGACEVIKVPPGNGNSVAAGINGTMKQDYNGTVVGTLMPGALCTPSTCFDTTSILNTLFNPGWSWVILPDGGHWTWINSYDAGTHGKWFDTSTNWPLNDKGDIN